MWPHRLQPTRLLCPWDSPGMSTGVGCHFLLQCMKVRSETEIAQSCPTLSDPMDCLPGSSAHGIFQARVLEWGAIAFSLKLLSHMIILYLTFWATAKLFFEVAEPFYNPTSSVGGLQFIHILTNACCFPCFLIAATLMPLWIFCTNSSRPSTGCPPRR